MAQPGRFSRSTQHARQFSSACLVRALGRAPLSWAGGGFDALVERWNGKRWSIHATPTDKLFSPIELDGVSCGSVRACIAVGTSTTGNDNCYGCVSSSAVVEQWNGRTWSIAQIRAPRASADTSLSRVSCSSALACTAVGYSDSGPGCGRENSRPCPRFALVERWDGSHWSIESTPRASRASLSGVSCTSATACTAVGKIARRRGHSVPFAERWDGSVWSVERTPKPWGAKRAGLIDVSCTSSTACTALGSLIGRVGDSVAFAERWNGSRWSIQKIRHPARGSGAAALSCEYTSSCTSGLQGLSCATRLECVAVGSVIDSRGDQITLAERWQHSRWSVRPTANNVIDLPTGLKDVSCPSAAACTAVGSFAPTVGGDSTLGSSLWMRWRGMSWSIELPANPAGPRAGADTAGVSCTSPTRCTAVGFFASHSLTAFAEGWSGTGWSIQHIPAPAGAASMALTGVSCTAVGGCEAVGSYQPGNNQSDVPLVEFWNGSGWSIQESPTPAGPASSRLNRVSCTSPTACMAVGYSYVGARCVDPNSPGPCTQLPFAEVWDGKSWSIQSPPLPASPAAGELTGVSCTTATACTAIGSFSTDISCVTAHGAVSLCTARPLAEAWNGSNWSIQNVPIPKGSANSQLNAVSCVTATACIAFGSDQMSPVIHGEYGVSTGGRLGRNQLDDPEHGCPRLVRRHAERRFVHLRHELHCRRELQRD